MHLRSTRDQVVRIPRADLCVQILENETIWTESSHKYAPEEVVQIAQEARFDCAAQWIDGEWPFAESLLIAQ